MSDITKANTSITLNENPYGVKIVRKNYKKLSRVKVLAKDESDIVTYSFPNIALEYQTQYMNWQNLDFCGGWIYSTDNLINQFIDDKKLFADIFIGPRKEEFNIVMGKAKKCIEDDNVVFCQRKTEDDGDAERFILTKKGCVADYLDIDTIIKEYKRFGVIFAEYEIARIKELASYPMSEFANNGSNTANFDFYNPKGNCELVFDGMLLGYPIESTVDLILY